MLFMAIGLQIHQPKQHHKQLQLVTRSQMELSLYHVAAALVEMQ